MVYPQSPSAKGHVRGRLQTQREKAWLARQPDEEARAAALRLPRHVLHKDHCSSIVKAVGATPSGGFSDIFITHTTWSGAETMNRIFKQYSMPFAMYGWGQEPTAAGKGKDGKKAFAAGPSAADDEIVPGERIAFSSYPATSYSADDFYAISSGLAVVETTISNNNATLWQYVQPNTVLDWARSMVANRLARTGPEWAHVFLYNNSGTYNNEFSVLDTNLFVPGQPLANGTLTIVDQMPGPTATVRDGSELLQEQGYFASYNKISDPALFVLTNQTALVDEYGPIATWDKCPRAQIFDRDHNKVVDGPSLQKLIRYNDWQHDPISTMGCAPGQASGMEGIASRADLTPPTYSCGPWASFGDTISLDGKYTSARMMQEGVTAAGRPRASGSLQRADRVKLHVWAQSSPTFDQQPPFSWLNTTLSNLGHAGQPDLWNFGWMLHPWE